MHKDHSANDYRCCKNTFRESRMDADVIMSRLNARDRVSLVYALAAWSYLP